MILVFWHGVFGDGPEQKNQMEGLWLAEISDLESNTVEIPFSPFSTLNNHYQHLDLLKDQPFYLMSEQSPTIFAFDATMSQSKSTTSTANVFDRMRANAARLEPPIKRDRCHRLTPIYNQYYDPNEPPCDNLPHKYSPYTHVQPLFDDRPAIPSRFEAQHTLAGEGKRLRQSWVWPLGYAVNNTTKKTKRGTALMWVCKLC